MEEIKIRLPGSGDFFIQESYKVLRTNLQFCGQDVQVVMITSCNENEGKSTVTLSLGKSLAELGKKVLVIDADMRKSVMAGRNSNVRNPAGLSEVLTGMRSLSDSVYYTQPETLHLLFAGKYPPNPVELLSGKYFTALIEENRKYYDYILIDTPPLGRVIDAAVVAPNCDGAILIIGDAVRYRQAQEVVEQLKKTGSRILGVVRNNIKKKSKGYYYSKKAYTPYEKRK